MWMLCCPIEGESAVMIKKWWVLALVVTLALSLTSCGKKKKQTTGNYGVSECAGTIGDFDVYTMPSSGKAGYYDVIVLTYQIAQPGDIATITIADSVGLGYKTLASQVVLQDEDEIFAGTISEAELQKYDTISITPFTTQTNFAEQNSEADATCELPLIGVGQ